MLVTMTRFLFSLTYGKELTAVNMQVAKQQVSVKGANNSPFLNELNPFFSCYGMPVLVSDMEDIWQTLILSRNWKLHPFLLYIKAAENTKLASGSDSIHIQQLFLSLRRRYLTPSMITVNCSIWINKTKLNHSWKSISARTVRSEFKQSSFSFRRWQVFSILHNASSIWDSSYV